MYLKSLELSGFKSFAKKAILDFNTPITGIVGPNGSGKSNAAEAFRFVLGEQSIKSLRGKRGEDMIWNGGGDSAGAQATGRANRAAVKLTFDNSHRIFPTIDFDEVAVERVVHRDNSNEYLLNGSQVRLKDVVEILAGAHIGATGHHIISQGEADRILSASIRDRREMIEDALGLKIYQWKKLESLRKLERTEENVKQVESLRREIAPHLRFLKKQVEKVEKAELMKRELVALYREYFAREESYVARESARLNAEIAGPRAELAKLDQELARAKDILAASKGKDHKSAEIIELETKLAAARADKDAITRELGRIEGEIGANSRAIAKERDKQKKDEFKTIYLKDVEQVVKRVEEFGSIDDAKKLFQEVVNVLKTFVARHRETTDSALIADAEAEVARLTTERALHEGKLVTIGETEAALVRQYNELKVAIEREKDTNREAEKDVFRIIARQNEVRSMVATLSAALVVLSNEEAAFKRELGEAGMIVGREATNYKEEQGKRENRLQEKQEEQEEQEPRTAQDERRKQIEKLKIRLEDAGGAGGSDILKEYKETEERDTFLARELEDLTKARAELLQLIADLETRLDVEFKEGILKINAQFGTFFSLMFGGGKAELVVVKEPKRRAGNDPISCLSVYLSSISRILRVAWCPPITCPPTHLLAPAHPLSNTLSHPLPTHLQVAAARATPRVTRYRAMSPRARLAYTDLILRWSMKTHSTTCTSALKRAGWMAL